MVTPGERLAGHLRQRGADRIRMTFGSLRLCGASPFHPPLASTRPGGATRSHTPAAGPRQATRSRRSVSGTRPSVSGASPTKAISLCSPRRRWPATQLLTDLDHEFEKSLAACRQRKIFTGPSVHFYKRTVQMIRHAGSPRPSVNRWISEWLKPPTLERVLLASDRDRPGDGNDARARVGDRSDGENTDHSARVQEPGRRLWDLQPSRSGGSG